MAMFGDFKTKAGFIENLPKIYGIYTGGFVLFILLMAVLEQMGMGSDTIGILFVAFTILIYALIGWLSRTMQIDAYYVAGRQVPPGVMHGLMHAACMAHRRGRLGARERTGWDDPPAAARPVPLG